ncbi:MAG: hypothetical protein AMXMBFR48_19480 [Ignavibacteriales bacterium]
MHNWKTPLMYILVLISVILLAGCGKKYFRMGERTEISLIYTVPPSYHAKKLVLVAGGQTVPLKKDAFSLRVSSVSAQMISINDDYGNPVMMSIANAGNTGTSVRIDELTTAESVVFMNPFLLTTDPAETEMVKRRIRSASSFPALVHYITAQIRVGQFSVDYRNKDLFSLVDSVLQEVIEGLASGSAVNDPQGGHPNTAAVMQSDNHGGSFTPVYASGLFVRSDATAQRVSFFPDYQSNNLEVKKLYEEGDKTGFLFRNYARRWIAVYKKNNEGFVSDTYVDIIPSVDKSLVSLLISQGMDGFEESTKHEFLKSEGEVQYQFYGPGNMLVGLNEREREKVITPVVLSAVFDMFVPMLELVSGFQCDMSLRGRPFSHPFSELIKLSVRQVFVSGSVIRLTKYINNNEYGKFVVEVSKIVFQVMLNNKTLFRDALLKVLPHGAATAFLKNWLWPVRLLAAVSSVANIFSAALVYRDNGAFSSITIRSGEFAHVIISGRVLTEGVPVPGMLVKITDKRGAFAGSGITNGGGFFRLTIPKADYNLVIQSINYEKIEKPLYQSSFLKNQIDCGTIALVNKSSRRIAGLVKDATTDLPLSGVKIEIKMGRNNPAAPVVNTVYSNASGVFEFSSSPLLDFTFFLSKDNYTPESITSDLLPEDKLSLQIVMSPVLQSNETYRIVLTWGSSPCDLDSHLKIPENTAPAGHIFYRDKGNENDFPFATLDIDDRNGNGPETITINTALPGMYYYSVHQYSSDGNLPLSDAVVKLYSSAGLVRQFTLPVGNSGRWWHIFSLNAATGQIQIINRINDESIQ